MPGSRDQPELCRQLVEDLGQRHGAHVRGGRNLALADHVKPFHNPSPFTLHTALMAKRLRGAFLRSSNCATDLTA